MALDNLPVGAIIAWKNEAMPSGWHVCDGMAGTPDLRDRFIYGASVDGDVRVVGGTSSHSHTNPNTGTRNAHNHGGSKSPSALGNATGTTTGTVGSGSTAGAVSHNHTIASLSVLVEYADAHAHTPPNTASASHLPIYVRRVFIQRVN
jgi:hypothetical protein